MQEAFKDKYFKEGIVDDRIDTIILSRNLNGTQWELGKKRTEHLFLEKHKPLKAVDLHR